MLHIPHTIPWNSELRQTRLAHSSIHNIMSGELCQKHTWMYMKSRSLYIRVHLTVQGYICRYMLLMKKFSKHFASHLITRDTGTWNRARPLCANFTELHAIHPCATLVQSSFPWKFSHTMLGNTLINFVSYKIIAFERAAISLLNILRGSGDRPPNTMLCGEWLGNLTLISPYSSSKFVGNKKEINWSSI